MVCPSSGQLVQRNPEKSMRSRHYELLWLIRHIGPLLSQNQADASLASLRNFLEAKNKMATGDYVLRNIFASKPLRYTILVSTSMLSGSMNQMMLNTSCCMTRFQDGRHKNTKSGVLVHSFAPDKKYLIMWCFLVNGIDIHLYIYIYIS